MGCSCVVVKVCDNEILCCRGFFFEMGFKGRFCIVSQDFGEEHEGLHVVQQHVKSH